MQLQPDAGMDGRTPLVRIYKTDLKALLPEYETAGAAGADIRARLSQAMVIPPLGRVRIPTGLVLEIPAGFEAQIRPRSGLAAKNGVTVLNSPGTIDSDYRGELQIILINLGSDDFTVNDGDRIAQMVIAPVSRALIQETAVLSETERGSGGFGSTGKK
ncbi:deoxyuridine 5'-triphosphate nucleotidohydrolase [Spirochaetia bacterium]|nr:deoxyuridine 5'-triphosphate nucleotidohydrolase [Spirochaetia bacterium]